MAEWELFEITYIIFRLADSANDVIKADKIFKNLPDEKRTELYEK